MKNRKFVTLALLLLLLVVFTWQCTEKYPADSKQAAVVVDGCVQCHTDAELLKKIATPLPPPDGEAGEG